MTEDEARAEYEASAEYAAIESTRTQSHAPIARLLRESGRRLVHQAQDLEHFGGSAAHLAACAKLREAARSLYREADAQERPARPARPAPAAPARAVASPARVTLDFVGEAPTSEPFRVYLVDKATVTANFALAHGGASQSVGMGQRVRESASRPGVRVVDVTISGSV